MNENFMLLAVTGNPIAHSKSPQILNAAMEEAGLSGADLRLAADNAEEAMETAKSLGVSGLNVTAPFKEDMIELVDEISDEAREIGAVNTITIKDGKTKGYNTDADGVKGALEGNGIKLMGKKVIILGAGGAARAAAFGLKKAGAKVTIANRTVKKADILAQKVGCDFCELNSDDFNSAIKSVNIVVSTLSTAEKIVDSKLLQKELVVLDAVYGKETQLTKDAKNAGCRIINGQEWLLFHAVKTFKIFTGKSVAIEVLRKSLQNSANKNTKSKRNIALIGFSGSGKSTASEELSKLTDMKIIHMDEEIERREGKTISQIFETEGETAFRYMEKDIISRLPGEVGKIISCGGGVVTNPENITGLKQNCTVVWLHSKNDTILKRIGKGSGRPLFNVENKEKKMQELMIARVPLYAKCCDLVISSDDRNPKEIAGLIFRELGSSSEGRDTHE